MKVRMSQMKIYLRLLHLMVLGKADISHLLLMTKVLVCLTPIMAKYIKFYYCNSSTCGS